MQKKLLLVVALALIGVGGAYYATRLLSARGPYGPVQSSPKPPTVAERLPVVDTPNVEARLVDVPAPSRPIQSPGRDTEDSLGPGWGLTMNELLAGVNSRETAKQYLQGILDQLLEKVSSDAVPPMVFVADDAIMTGGERFGDLKKMAREKGRFLYATVEKGDFHFYEFHADSGFHLPPAVKSFLTADDFQEFQLQTNMISIQNSAARKAARRAQK